MTYNARAWDLLRQVPLWLKGTAMAGEEFAVKSVLSVWMLCV